MATATLKPFILNTNDLLYLLAQVNFVPLFEGPANSNGIVNFDPATMDAWDARGNQVWNHATHTGSYRGLSLTDANVALLGPGFPQVSSPIGIRDVSGLHNNLFGTQADWGAVDVPFRRDIAADFTNYVTADATGGSVNYAPGNSVIDYMPRMISRTVTTAGVNLLKDAAGHFVTWDAAKYGTNGADGTDPAYGALVNASGVAVTKLVAGAKIVAPVTTEIAVLDYDGTPLVWSQARYTASILYTTTIAQLAAESYGGLKDSNGGTLDAGETIYARSAPGAPLITTDLTYQPAVLAYKQLIDANVDFSAAPPADGPVVTTLSETGYGLLETLGHVDFQNPTSGEFFIGSENPGVAPVNSWFAIFGQFFDHGLDLIGKGGNGTITIALDPNDPLYGSLGPDGQPVTNITISRATIAGNDPNGDPNYVNHTSPFIDQSQTYGSVDQITQLLRKWVSTDNGSTYHAGLELLDGTTLVDAWERRWPDGTTSMVHDTLPTLNELRAHVLSTGRDALTWADVLDYRVRDSAGKLLDADTNTAGVQTTGSGHALILDMNPHFDAEHVSTANLNALNTELTAAGLSPFTADSLSYGELITAGLINPATNLINTHFPSYFPAPMGGSAIPATLQAAVDAIMLDSVGDHYIAGDGRVNENFGLTSIHHVFHEEHNFQVENLKNWIYQHDTANSPTTHEGLHSWQVNTGTRDGAGNYLNADGSIAWDSDKMFNATKLIVEMEYQHAAVDQYARTITPRIQEFVGYSSGVDPTVSLEYSQVAFRFGHSTIRETIDTLDPSGWMLGNVTRYALEKAFLAPQTFAEEGVAAITLGLSRQQMSEVDEFVTPALNQGLLGQPLDLAAINIARGRDLGIPTLNDFRAGIGLVEYTSWADYGANMIHPESLVNFIAAYSFGGDIAKAADIVGLADGSITTSSFGFTSTDAVAFMNNNAAGNAELNTARLGFDKIDSWIGGLAEAHVPGGLLGETFDAVFVAQIQSLMDGDRFYYLYRLFGTNIHEEVNNGQFKDIVERNTGLSHLNGSIFAYADRYYDFNRGADGTLTDVNGDHANHLYADLVNATGNTKGIYSDGGDSLALNGTDISVDGVVFIRDVRPELDPTQVHTVEGTPTSGADSHEVIVATDYDDYIHARSGDDTVYGEKGNDKIFGDGGVDRLYGGDGDDLIDAGEGPDLADGGSGKDTIYGRGSGSEVGGFDQLVGGSGNDLIVGGEGIDKLSGGSGDDIIYGDGLANPEMGNTDPFTHGGDGNDYIDGGASGDLLYGEEGDDYLVGGNDQDLIQGGQGDDIIRPGAPSQAINGGPDEVIGDDGFTNTGFDLVDFSDRAAGAPGVTLSLLNQANPLVAIDGTTPVPAMAQMEGIIGSRGNDNLSAEIVADLATALVEENNWLIGGAGNDTLTGAAGNDVLIGGSIRLDELIGKYADAANASAANGQIGSAEWLAAAMQSGGTGTGYDNNTEDAYTGASNRAVGALTGGLLAGVNASIAGTANDFDLHFQEMLRSRMFKDVVLGDGGTDGTADTAVFSGNLAQYSLVALDATGAVVADPHANWAQVLAIKVTDNRTAADLLDQNGAPLLDTNGNPITLDGTDLIIGVEQLKFADQTINPAAYFDKPPVVDLNYMVAARNTLDQFGSNNNAYSQNNGNVTWNGSWQESNDGGGNNGGSGSGQITRTTVNNNGLLQFGSGNGAEITRGVGQVDGTPTSIVFELRGKNGIGNGETLTVLYSVDGTTFTALQSFGSADAIGTKTIDISTLSMTANSAIQFSVSSLANNDRFLVDNVRVNFSGDVNPGINTTAAYTEQLAPAVLTANPLISDLDDTKIYSATVHIRETVAGDQLTLSGNLQAGLTATGTGTGTLVLLSTSGATFAEFQAALQAVRFSNTGDNPTNTTRHLDVTVNDGLRDSAVATTTVTVTPVNDPTVTGVDTIVTNIALNANIAIPDWALLANDTDPDSPLSITSISNGTNGISTSSFGAGHSGTTTTVRDSSAGGGTFTYSVNGVTGNVTVAAQQTGTTLNGTAGADILIGTNATTTFNGADGRDILIANGGDDTLDGGAGDDIINSTITTSGGQNPVVTSGRDVIDGGANDAAGDRFILNGANGPETFNIYTRSAWLAVAGNTAAGINAASEIVITRNGTNAASIVSELDNIEEITVNGTPRTNGAPVNGMSGGDTINVFGNFSETSLNLNTITIQGAGRVDITGLDSSHRVVIEAVGPFELIGQLRSQDVLILPEGVDKDAVASSTVNGVTTLATSVGTISFAAAADARPLILGADEDVPSHTQSDVSSATAETDDVVDEAATHVDCDMGSDTGDVKGTGSGAVSGTSGTPPTTTPLSTTPLSHVVFAGTLGDDASFGGAGDDNLAGAGGNDSLFGEDGDDNIVAGDGHDDVFAGNGADIVSGGAGNDRLFGDAGDDVMLGGAGNDRIDAGDGHDRIWGDAGRDVVNGGLGNDVIFAIGGDGNDIIHGDGGIDTVNYEEVTGPLLIDLDAGIARSDQTGEDALSGIENAIGGSGRNTFYANDLDNVLTAGSGQDTFVFRTAADAKGDTIEGFQAGDTISLSQIFGSTPMTVQIGGTFNAAGQIRLVADANGNTLVEGNTDGDGAAEFSILVTDHVLKTTDFTS